jgi:hypothetical protein
VGLTALTPAKVAALFGAGAAVVLLLVYLMMTVLGLPTWVFVGAIALLAVGLPIMLVTGRHEQQRAVAATTGMHVTTPVGVRKHFTWRRATLGGGLAFVGLAVVAGGFMAMRLLGIGPVGTLVASGVLDEQARLVLADFENATSDSTLGETVAELFRIDLNESPAITLLSTGQVANILARMERPEDTPLTPDVVSEIAIREGIKAYLAGDIRSLGESYLLAARLVSAETGEEFMSVSEQANTSADIMGAVDRMSTAFRERIGESYSSLRADPPLERSASRRRPSKPFSFTPSRPVRVSGATWIEPSRCSSRLSPSTAASRWRGAAWGPSWRGRGGGRVTKAATHCAGRTLCGSAWPSASDIT